MLRYSLVLLAGLWAAGSAGAASWADGLFDELSKDFGSVPRGPTLSHHFRVSNNTRTPVNIASVRVSCGCVSAVALKTYLRPGETTAIVAHMDTSRFTGVRTVTIYVQLDAPAFEEVRLWVKADGRNDFAVVPATLAMGQVKRTTAPQAAVTITFYGSGDARIVQARGESNYVRASFRELRRLESEVVYQVSASLRPDTPVGRWYTDVWVKTNLAAMPQVRVPLTVEIESPLSVSPETVTLGRVKVKGESERRVIVRGIKPFLITRVQGGDRQLLVRDTTPARKQIHVLTIHLKADTPGELSRTLRVLTDLGGEENEIDFRVTASVIP
jgi:hypothetical protein